jgi:[ribosomal protein S5]-alanine N-acetyltransferase
VERDLAHQAEHGYGLWVVVRTGDGRVVGDCGLEWQEVAGETLPELGYDLRRDAWGRGYATEAARAVRDHAFGALGLAAQVSAIRRGNDRSVAVARRVGMRHHTTVGPPGVPYDVYRVERPG